MHSENHAESAGPVRRFLSRAGIRAAMPYLAMGILLAIAVVTAGRELDRHINAIEAWILQLGPWGPLAFVALFVLTTSLLVPDTVLCIIAGALFGMVWGAAAVVAGGLIAGALQFALARRLLRARIELAVQTKPSLAAIQRAVVHDELRLQVLLRLTPLNPATISYLLGAAGVRFTGFLLACLALAPNLIIGVYFGHAGKHMVRMAGGASHTGRLHDLVIIGGVVVCVAVMVLVSRMARKALTQAVAATQTGTSGPDSSTK